MGRPSTGGRIPSITARVYVPTHKAMRVVAIHRGVTVRDLIDDCWEAFKKQEGARLYEEQPKRPRVRPAPKRAARKRTRKLAQAEPTAATQSQAKEVEIETMAVPALSPNAEVV
jgi:hypothetical protein